ncbi:STAS domain-containing protein [Siminovitchia sp. FSL H7-0308]|uniref:Anti-anti-sigma regulatory factor n=1 Tax=Siminovitchia thermophila TaxID=1245522 RepID=A0ABS2R1W1_9BACI|nr:STAS domain-containing protein [Siminovitchia thermophila]MBM7713124.1 anti-anti-sigma regulatory factor [Siminovitchia thermophila]ONK24842.1 anti-anti-sigma factor [Bacillus sp. VT-16-64]
MELTYHEDQDIKAFLKENRDQFEKRLLEEAVNVRDKIEEIRQIGNINLLENAHKLVLFVVEGRGEEVVAFANQEGEAWARFSLTLSFKLEWVQAIRRTLWAFLHQYDYLKGKEVPIDQFYAVEKEINQGIDQFLNRFFIAYSKFKDELIESQRKMVENLSAPIIPIDASISVLPLIGSIDNRRSASITEKVLMEISSKRIQTLIMDLSGVGEMEPYVIDQFLKMIDGIEMMGCKAVITGLHPVVVKKVIDLGVSFGDKAILKGTLQQAIRDYLLP